MYIISTWINVYICVCAYVGRVENIPAVVGGGLRGVAVWVAVWVTARGSATAAVYIYIYICIHSARIDERAG